MPPPPHRGSVEILRGSRVAKKFLQSSMELNLNFWRGRAVQTKKKKSQYEAYGHFVVLHNLLNLQQFVLVVMGHF